MAGDGIFRGAPLAVTSLGADPGGTTGLLLACWIRGERRPAAVRAWQVQHDGATELLGWILGAYGRVITCAAMEAFMPGAGRRDPLTRDLCVALEREAAGRGVTLRDWPAATVKPWTGDKKGDRRLKEAGLFEVTAGQPHARDSARYALYAAVHDGRLPDPLSRQRRPPGMEMTMGPAHVRDRG
jgi:hypothetical protein